MAQKGDQYQIPIEIKLHNRAVTPTLCDDVRIMLNETLKTYAEGDITFDNETNKWLYPVSQEDTRNFPDVIPYQVGIKIGDTIVYSKPQKISWADSIIKENWE